MAMRVVGCMPLSLSFTVGRRSSRVCFAKGNNNHFSSRHFVCSTRIGGKKFKIEIDSSIWREEIQNRNRLLDILREEIQNKNRLLDIWREEIQNRNRLLEFGGKKFKIEIDYSIFGGKKFNIEIDYSIFGGKKFKIEIDSSFWREEIEIEIVDSLKR